MAPADGTMDSAVSIPPSSPLAGLHMNDSTMCAQSRPASVSASASDRVETSSNMPPRDDTTSNLPVTSDFSLAMPVDADEDEVIAGNSELENEEEYEDLRKECDEMMNGPPKFTMEKNGNHWASCRERMEKSDNAACKAWGDDVDALLVFAGLFSAVVTAFTVESYQWLDVDSSDVTAVALLHISAQLAGEEQGTYTPDPFAPSSLSRRINSYWFLSLVLALLSALLGILCKQWLREYQAAVPVPHQRTIAARQMRFDALHFWKVDDVLASLPLLLEAALILFFVGILELLWSRDRTVAIIITLACSVGLIIVLSTTVLPAIIFLLHVSHDVSHDDKRESIPPCAFKSPQSWLLLKLVVFLKASLFGDAPIAKPRSWYGTERRMLSRPGTFRYYTSLGLHWIDEQFSRHKAAVLDVNECITDLEPWACNAPLLLEKVSFSTTTDEGDQKALLAFSFMLSKYDEHFVDNVPSNKYLAETLLRMQETSPSVMRQLSRLEWGIEMQAACPALRFSIDLPFSSFEARRERNLLLQILVEALRDHIAAGSYGSTAVIRYATEEAILKTLSAHRTEAGILLRKAVTDWEYWENREGPNDARIILRRFASINSLFREQKILRGVGDWQVLLREVADLEVAHHLQFEAMSEDNEQGLGIYGWMGRIPVE
ncbi:hypothetical protein BDZ89DRAFT_1071159 [Hymenopellis radicata]|nr:hypothetical protein BDZ89DRAFT_1071159 [Hymenopellis radicata]